MNVKVDCKNLKQSAIEYLTDSTTTTELSQGSTKGGRSGGGATFQPPQFPPPVPGTWKPNMTPKTKSYSYSYPSSPRTNS